MLPAQLPCPTSPSPVNLGSSPPSIPSIADTGATGHFCPIDAPLINIQPTQHSIPVSLPDGTTIHSSHIAELDLPFLPHQARVAHIFPHLSSGSLISIGQLCDAGCTATFDATTVTITYQYKVVLSGTRSPITRLWHLNITPSHPTMPTTLPLETALGASNPTTSTSLNTFSAKPAELVTFAHAALCSPALSTLCTALDNHYITGFPGLTSALVRKYPPRSVAMVKGHLDQTRTNLRSTKPTPLATNVTLAEQSTPEPPGTKTHYCFAACLPSTGQIFTDQTGRFITPSSKGNNDIFLLYDYDSNYIHAEPMKNRTAPEILAAYQRTHRLLTNAGLRPLLQRLDNECSQPLKDFMKQEGVDYQLVPPHVHRRNAAERAIRTFKNHFIAALCSTDKEFPLHLWDRLLPQALLTLNLLRGSRLNPKLSSHAQVHGPFDYNRTPLAPPGIRVLLHEKPSTRTTWSPHATDGWYIGPALESYRCYRVWVWETRHERISDTLTWFPTKVTMPLASSVDLIIAGANDIVHALQHPTPNSPLAPLTDSEAAALTTLTDVLLTRGDPVTPITDQTPTEPPIVPPSVPPFVPPVVPPPAPSLRVATPPKPILPPPVPSLRVPKRSGATTAPTAHTRRKNLQTPASASPTYANSTGAHGRLRRRTQGRSTKKSHRYPTRSKACLATTSDSLHHTAAHLSHQLHGHTAAKAIHPDNGNLVEYRHLLQSSDGAAWENANCNEIGRLAQGYKANSINGTDTIHFIHVHEIPNHKKPTYVKIVAADRPNKVETKRIRWTAGGDRVEYIGDVSTKTADLTTAKCLFNSVISTPDAEFMTIDVKDFYLNTPMSEFEYIRIPVTTIPDAIMNEYNLWDKIYNGAIYAEVRKGMYGLPQAGKIANDRLVNHLKTYGYHQAKHTHGLFTHETNNVVFTLVVDDFGVKYTSRASAQHLIDALASLYNITTDWTGTTYLGLTIAWDYKKRICDISMPNYVAQALQRFTHPLPPKPQDSPHAWTRPVYGAHTQLTAPLDDTAPLSPEDRKRLQEVIGTLLYYSRAIDSTMLVTLGTLAAAQTISTQATAAACTQLLNYCATHPDGIIRYHASEMILHVHSDASYLSEAKARSRAGGIHYLGNRFQPSDAPTILNGAVLVLSNIMRQVLASAAEAELGALFYNGKEATTIRTTLIEMGHPQPATPMQTDNSTAFGIANATVKQRRSKAIDMRFYWIRDRVQQGHFLIHWKRGTDNHADYFTKHHPPTHHRAVRSQYLQPLVK
jgi:hypothetical protein